MNRIINAIGSASISAILSLVAIDGDSEYIELRWSVFFIIYGITYCQFMLYDIMQDRDMK